MLGTSLVTDLTIMKVEIPFSTYCYRIRMLKSLNEVFSDGKQGGWIIFKFSKVTVKFCACVCEFI